MKFPIDPLSRRALLTGTCASLLLPLLPSLSWADDPSADEPKAPKRWVTILFPNGVLPDHWWAKGTGRTMELSKSLKPLDDHRGMFSVLNGLHLFDHDPNEGPHVPFFTNFLAGSHIHNMTESCDQVMARTIGQYSFLPSLALGVEEPGFGLSAGGHNAMYDQTISWASPTSPIPPLVSPRDAFDALFDTKGLVSRKSVLDCLIGDIKDIQGQLSSEDSRKLDEYTATVRDLERRIEIAVHPPQGGWQPALKEPNIARPAQTKEKILAQSHGVRHRLMLQILTLALHMDRTRVATLLLGGDGTFAPMNFIPGVSNTQWHMLAHHATNEQAIREYQLTNEYHVSLLAKFMKDLQSIDEGGQSLLDNSMILFGSNVMDGGQHDGDKLPLILAGGGGGTLTPGANLTFTTLEDRRLCNLHLALMQRMGVTVEGKPIQSFSSSIKPLVGI